MSVTSTDGEIIYENTASPMTRAYRDIPGNVVHAQFFGKDKLKEMIDDAGTDYLGIRIYNAVDDNNNPCFVLTCVKQDGHDRAEGKLLANGPICPSCCDAASPLNE